MTDPCARTGSAVPPVALALFALLSVGCAERVPDVGIAWVDGTVEPPDPGGPEDHLCPPFSALTGDLAFYDIKTAVALRRCEAIDERSGPVVMRTVVEPSFSPTWMLSVQRTATGYQVNYTGFTGTPGIPTETCERASMAFDRDAMDRILAPFERAVEGTAARHCRDGIVDGTRYAFDFHHRAGEAHSPPEGTWVGHLVRAVELMADLARIADDREKQGIREELAATSRDLENAFINKS